MRRIVMLMGRGSASQAQEEAEKEFLHDWGFKLEATSLW